MPAHTQPNECTTGLLGWLGAIALGLILGGAVTAIAGPLIGVATTGLIIWGGVRTFANQGTYRDRCHTPSRQGDAA